MDMETGKPDSKQSVRKRPIDTDNSGVEDHENVASLREALRQRAFSEVSDKFKVHADTEERGETLRLQIGVLSAAEKLTDQVRSGAITLEEAVEDASKLAWLLDDTGFEQRAMKAAAVIDQLQPGTCVFPRAGGALAHWAQASMRDDYQEFFNRIQGVARVVPDPGGRAAIVPVFESLFHDDNRCGVDVALEVSVIYGDGSEDTVLLKFDNEEAEPIIGDEGAIRYELDKRSDDITKGASPLQYQALAESYRVIGDTEKAGMLERLAHDYAYRNLEWIIERGDLTNQAEGPRFLMLYNPELMQRLYDQYAESFYQSAGGILNDFQTHQGSINFLRTYTSANAAINARGDKAMASDISLTREQGDAVYEFLQRGKELYTEREDRENAEALRHFKRWGLQGVSDEDGEEERETLDVKVSGEYL